MGGNLFSSGSHIVVSAYQGHTIPITKAGWSPEFEWTLPIYTALSLWFLYQSVHIFPFDILRISHILERWCFRPLLGG